MNGCCGVCSEVPRSISRRTIVLADAPFLLRYALALNSVFKALTSLEGRGFGGRDLDLLGRAGPDTFTRLSVPHFEGAEAGELHLIAPAQVLTNVLEHALNDGSGIFLADARRFSDFINQMRFGYGIGHEQFLLR